MTFFYLMFPAILQRVHLVDPHKIRACAMTLYGVQCAALLLAAMIGGGVDPVVGFWWARSWPPFRLPVFIM